MGALETLERQHSARLGVFAYNTETRASVLYRADERFPMCSVFKTVAVAAVVRDLDRDGEFLAQVVRYTVADIDAAGGPGAGPITNRPENLANGMTVAALCAAAIQYSDNVAANLLLRELGGPSAVTRFCRSVGDSVTRLDRWEPALNSAEPGRITDTTTPRAIGGTYGRLTLGRVLDDGDRGLLTGWLLGNTTSGNRFRAGLPAGWTLADKTGTGDYGTTNDVGIAWPQGRGPIVLAVLSTRPDDPDAAADEPLVAKAAELLAAALCPQSPDGLDQARDPGVSAVPQNETAPRRETRTGTT
ncbi:MAG: beta-lactamase class [Streptomyces sp.]|nr:beta-lactamase class [Streptomyces sp.]